LDCTLSLFWSLLKKWINTGSSGLLCIDSILKEVFCLFSVCRVFAFQSCLSPNTFSKEVFVASFDWDESAHLLESVHGKNPSKLVIDWIQWGGK
jgi:hypothetical protein